MRGVLVMLSVPLVFACPAGLSAQQPGSAGQSSSGARSAPRADVAYTGMRIAGRPAPAPDGTPRWADFPVVRGVDAGSPAARVGVQAGDVILSVNGADARDPRTLFGPPGTTFTLRIRRGTEIHEFEFVGGPAPSAR
jgi:S1-C subfamily serine protease